MGGGILQIAANSVSNSIFNDQNYTLFKVVYRKYTPFSIEDYILNLTSISDFGKKIDVSIPKVGDLLTDMMLVIDLPEVSGEYIFNNQTEYMNSLKSQYTFSTMNDIQQYNENIYKLTLGNNLQVYLVRISTSISQISPPHYTTVYQLMFPLLDTSMFLLYGKKQKYSLQSFLDKNSQFFDNEYKLHTIQDFLYTPNPNISNIDYINYSFQDKEFYFFINNLLNIKQIDPNYTITYYNEWQDTYFSTVKKYILRRPEITALNTFIENMNTQISNSIQINNYVFNYENIFSISPLDYQYNVILPISYTTDYYLLFTRYEQYQNNKNYLLDYTSSFFSIFNRNYLLIKRDNSIIGACIINSIKDINPLNVILQPYRHIFTNKLIETYGNNLYLYYGFDTNQLEPINFAKITHIKLNINNYHEFEIDRSIDISVNSTILIGINFQNETPINSYNNLYGIFKINNICRTLNGIDNNSISNYNTSITAIPIEIDQLYLTDTILMTSYNNSNTITYYPTFNKKYESTYTNSQDVVNNVKQVIYTDVSISTINIVPIKSISESLIRDIIFAPDFVLTTSTVIDINNTIQTYLYDSYDVLFNYMKNIYYKTIVKSNNNLDYLNNLYFKINYTQSNNLFSFVDGGNTTFTNLVNGTFRYQQFLIDTINKHVVIDGQYTGQLNYTNFLTTHIINQYKILSDIYNNQWSASLLDIRNNSSDIFIKILNYLQYNDQNVNGRRTILTFTTDPITFTKSDLLSLTLYYYQKEATKNTIADYTLISNIIPINVITKIDNINNTISFDLTSFILAIEQSFNLQNIDFSNSYFTYSIDVDETSTLNILNLNTYLDNYSNDLIQIVNDNENITNQLYGNNVLLDYINTQHEVMFGNMKNYELSRQYIIRNGGSKYNVYQEDIIDLPTTQIPLLVNNTFIVKYNSEEYFPRFLYSKQLQIYQNIYQKVNELSENYFIEPSYIYFVNNINYVRSDGYNYTNDAQGSIPYLDPNQIPLLIHPVEYSYNLLDKISIHNISIAPPTFSFIQYLEELEEHITDYLQSQYLETYWNSYFIKNGTNTTTTNAYFAALAGKDDGLLIYYIYKYTSELAAYYGDMYNLNLNLDDTYFQTIYQFSPNILGTLLFQIYSAIMNTTTIPAEFDMYNTYNQIIQNQVDLSTVYNRYQLLPEYQNINNVEFTTNVSNIISEITYIFQVVSRLCTKYKINLILTSELVLSNYPIIYKIHGSNQMVKIILASDQSASFNSTVVFPTGYTVDEYYKVFNLSIHYDYLKYLFFAGYGGILRDNQYTDKTLPSFYQKLNNYLIPLTTNIDFAFFYANQLGIYLPNMEGNIVQSYQAWIQRANQPYFYYFNTLSLFYDMMYIYQDDPIDPNILGSGRSFISEYYTKNSTTTTYNNRPDIIQGELVYSTRMAYGTRDNKNRLAGVSMRYNLLDQRLYGILKNFNNISAPLFDYENDPIQIMNILTNLNTRFTDYQEFLVLFKNSMNITGSYINQTTKKYSDITTQFKVNSTNITDIDLFTGWNNYLLNYATNQNYIFSSIITGLSTAITQYNQLESDTLNFASVGYELYNFMNNFYNIHERNFGDVLSLRYLCNTNYHHIIDEYNSILNNLTYFNERNNLQSDIDYRNNNYSLVSLNFLNITIDKVFGLYQSDISVFKELFKNVLNYRQTNVQNPDAIQISDELLTDYNSINDVTSLTFYDKFFKFSNNVDYHLIPQIYHDLYNIQNASHTVVFYLNYLYSYLSTKSAKPNINDFDNPDLPVSYYYIKYLSSGLDYFLANFHELKLDNTQFYPYKNVPNKVNIYDSSGTIITSDRSKSFMYIFMLYKIQYRNYIYGTIDDAFTYNSIIVDNNPIRQITGLNMFTDYIDINKDVTAFDTLINNAALIGNIDYLQNITHPFMTNKHMDNLLFIKDLLNDLTTVNDNDTINVILPNNENYIEFLNNKIIVTNSFDTNGLIFGGYPYTLGILSDYNYIGALPAIIDNNGNPITTYVEGNVVLPPLIYKIYYFLISECFILNQTELIGSSFQNTNMSLGNIVGQVLAVDWKKGLLNVIAEYLYLILKSKKIIYQNSIYEIKYYDLYSRLQLFTTTDRLNDIVDMYLNSLLNIKITTYTVQSLPVSIYGASYEQFKIPNVFSLSTIKNNFNYSIYYQLIFALRQSLIGKYNNFEERVQFHNTYDYWLVNNTVLISDYSVIEYPENSNINYLVKNVDKTNVLNALDYYHNDHPESNYIRANIPPNVYTTIINFIITSTYNTIFPTNTNTNNNLATNIVYAKNGYNVVMTLKNVCFDINPDPNTSPYYNITINTGNKTISGSLIISNNMMPYVASDFSLIYSYMPFGYEYNFTTDQKELSYEQLLYNKDIYILQTMFQIFQNVQNIEQSLNLLQGLLEYLTPPEPTEYQYQFMHFSLFIESYIYFNFTSNIDPTKKVTTSVSPLTTSIGSSTLFNFVFTNWSEYYGEYFYVYVGNNPILANFLGSAKVVFANGVYQGSVYLTFNATGKQYISVTNQYIDLTHPFGSSDVAINVVTPITVSNIGDGSLDNNYAIITIPRSIKITIFGWSGTSEIKKLYTFVSTQSDGTLLQNTSGGLDGDGPFDIEKYQDPNSNVDKYRINAILTFPTPNIQYIYISDVQSQEDFSTATIFALIPNLSHLNPITIVNDIPSIAKNGIIDRNISYFTIPTLFTITLTNWDSIYRINELYVYFSATSDGQNLGDDQNVLNRPLTDASIAIVNTNNTFTLSFTANFLTLGNHYIYLSYYRIDPITNPFGTPPINFKLNPIDQVYINTIQITTVTGILNQYIAITNLSTNFTVSLGNWLADYTNVYGITQLYIYTKNVTDPDVYSNYIPINNLPNVTYTIIPPNNINPPNNTSNYILNFTTQFSTISQKYLYLTLSPITIDRPFGSGAVNIQISNPPGSLSVFNYIDVIPPFTTNYISKNLVTYTNNTIEIHVNNYSPNYNIYKVTPNLLYLFLGTTSNPTSIYNSGSPIPLIFDNNNILTYGPIYTTSINPVYIFVSDNIVYGAGLIKYGAGFLTNIIGNVNGVVNLPTFLINTKIREILLTLTNWDPSYASINGINNLFVYLGLSISNPTAILNNAAQTITKPNDYVVNFNTNVNIASNTYNVYISDNTPSNAFRYVRQLLTNQIYVTNQIFISSLTPSISPVPTFTSVTYNGVIGNWSAGHTLFPTTLYLFIGQTITNTTPYTTTVTVNASGNFSFTTTVTKFNFIRFALSDNSTYGSGYLETATFQITTVIGPVNASLIAGNYAITGKSTNYSIRLTNWDSTYNLTQANVYFNLYDYGNRTISFVSGVYYINFSATLPSIANGEYTLNIAGTNLAAQQVANNLFVTLQIALSSSVTTVPSPFVTFTSTDFTITINNWQNVFPNSLYLYYTNIYTNVTTSELVTITNNFNTTASFIFTKTINNRPGIQIAVSDSNVYGNGYLESNLLTINNSIGPVNANLTTNNYAIFNKSTPYNIVLTNWDTSYFDVDGINTLQISFKKNASVIIIGTYTINTSPNYYLNFSNTFSTGLFPSNVYKLRMVNSSLISQDICDFNYGEQISINIDQITPSPFKTYTFTQFDGHINNWYPNYYPNELNLSLTTTVNKSIMIAGGYSTNNPLIYSFDGLTWYNCVASPSETNSPNPNNFFYPGACVSIAWNGSLFIATGYSASIYTSAYSSDGIHWNYAANNIFDGPYNIGYGSVWIGDKWIIVGANAGGYPSIGYSYNGINWINTGSTLIPGGYCVAWNGSLCLVGGDGRFSAINTIIYSSDGLSWSYTNNTLFADGVCYTIAWNGSKWVAGGYNGGITPNTITLIYSTDGINWTNSGSTLFEGGYGYTVACNGSLWLAGGVNAGSTVNILYSYDGITWLNTNTTLFNGGRCNQITWNGQKWFAVGYNSNNTVTIIYSNDGLTWYDSGSNKFTGGTGTSIIGDIILPTDDTVTSTVTINPIGNTFTFTDTIEVLPNIKIALSDQVTYGTGYIESAKVTLLNEIGPVNASKNINNLIQNKSKTITITLNQWNSSYSAITELYVYIGSINTPVESYGLFTIYLDTDDLYKIDCAITPTVALGTYNMYISDTDPTLTSISSVRQILTSQLNVRNQISLPNIEISPIPFVSNNTYTFSGTLNDWYTEYGTSLTLYITRLSTNTVTSSSVNINSYGQFSYTTSITTLPSVSIAFSDNTYGTGYIESNIYITPNCGVNIGNLLYAGGSELYNSTDGINWNVDTKPNWITTIKNITYNGASWLMVGNDNIAISFNSNNTWVQTNLLNSQFTTCNMVAWNGSMWILATEPNSNTPLLYSYDGLNWQNVNTNSHISQINSSLVIASNGSYWIAGGYTTTSNNKIILKSTDGLTWTAYTSISTATGNSSCTALCWNGEKWIAGFYNTIDGGYFYSSTDGETWTIVTGITGNPTGVIFTGVCNGITWNGDMWVAVGDNSNDNIAYSYDGDIWYYGSGSNFSNPVTSITYSKINNQHIWIAVSLGQINYSYNGINWLDTLSGVNITQPYTTIASQRILPNIGNNEFALTCNSTNIKYSLDSNTWYTRSIPSWITTINNIAYNGSYWVITGGEGSNPGLAVSANGLIWTRSNVSSFKFTSCNGIAWNSTANSWVLALSPKTAATTSLLYSTNGISWNNVNNSVFDLGLSVAWNGSLWVSGGKNMITNKQCIYTSSNGVDWTASNNSNTFFVTNASIGGQCKAIIWSKVNNTWIASGSSNNNNTVVISSSNGSTWTNISGLGGSGGGSSLFTTICNGLASNRLTSVAVGNSSNSIAYTSNITNFGNFTYANNVFTNEVTSITWTGSKFLAVSGTKEQIATSPNGIDWTFVENNNVSNRYNSICSQNELPQVFSPIITPITYTLNIPITFTFTLNFWNVNISNLYLYIARDQSLGNILYIKQVTGFNVDQPIFTADITITDVYTYYFVISNQSNPANFNNPGAYYETINIPINYGISPLPIIAVGGKQNNNIFSYSTNTNTWTNKVNTTLTAPIINITYDNSMWLIATQTGLYYSTDNTNIYATNADTHLSKGIVNDIAWNGSKWIAVGIANNTSAIITSTNGITWSSVANDIFKTSASSVTWNNTLSKWYIGGSNYKSLWVAGCSGNPQSFIYSYDGMTWSSNSNTLFNVCNNIKYNGYMWIAVGTGSNKMAYSYDGISWDPITNNNTFFTSCFAIEWNGKLWVAGGNNTVSPNSIMVSTDGLNWTPSNNSTSILQVAYALGYSTTMWVAGGTPLNGYNSLAYSTDALTWTASNNGNSIFSSVCTAVANNGTLWVAGGSGTNSLAYSSNGMTWIASTNGNTILDTCNTITWNGIMWIAGGNLHFYNGITQGFGIAYSYDGMTWINITLPIITLADNFINISSIKWDGKLWIAGGSNDDDVNRIFYSYDGINWLSSINGSSFLQTVQSISVNTTLKNPDIANRATIISSSNGTTWTPEIDDAITNNFILGTGTNPNGTTMVYTYDNINWTPITHTLATNIINAKYNGNMWLATGYRSGIGASILTSTDGINWTDTNTTIFGNSAIGAIEYNSYMWVAGSGFNNNAYLGYSYDGINWFDSGSTLYVSGSVSQIVWNEKLWVAIGQMSNTVNSIAYSYDGINWVNTNDTLFAFTSGVTVAWNGSLWVVGGSGNTTSMGYSYDGITWYPANNQLFLGNASGVLTLAWNSTIWVAGGCNTNRTNGSLLWSNDGMTWTKSTTSIYEGGQVQKVIWTGYKFIAMGYIISPSTVNVFSTSTDGKTWTLIDSSSLTNNGYDLTYGSIVYKNNRYNKSTCNNIVCSNSVTIAGRSNSSISNLIYTNDNITWKDITGSGNTIFSSTCNKITSNDTRFVAVGNGTNSIAYSDNGIDWIPSASGNSVFTAGAKSITYDNIKYFAVGIDQIATSDDGITWTSRYTNTNAIYSNIIANATIPMFITGMLLYKSINNVSDTYICTNYLEQLPTKITNIIDLLQLPPKIFVNEHTPFNIKLNNWSYIIDSINLYSTYLYDFSISIGVTNKDKNPTFVCTPTLICNNNSYFLNIPPLKNIHNKFMYISIIVNNQSINFPPILINKTTLLLKNNNSNFKIKDKNEIYTFDIIGKALKLYVYASTQLLTLDSDFIDNLEFIIHIPVVNNKITFTYKNNSENIYFYVSSGENFTGITSIVEPIHLIDINTINIKLDNYDINTNKHTILLDNWNITDMNNINILSNNFIQNVEILTFSPININNCKLWLDAYNINSFNLENDNIISWFDKSNNNNHAQTNKVHPGYNIKYNCVYFNKDSYLTLPDNTIPLNNTNYHIFMVLTPQNTKNSYNFIMGSFDNIIKPTDNEINTFLLDNNTYNNSWKNNDIISTQYEPNTIQLVSFEYINNNKRNIYINSNIVQTNNLSNSNNLNNSSKNNLIGGIINKFTYTGGIHEIIIYNSIMSTSDKQQIDNYLINKWNIKK